MLGSDRKTPSGFVEQLTRMCAGGAVLFGRDVGDAEQLRALNDSISDSVERACGIRPFIAVDQEGGPVARLRGELCPALPANEDQGLLYLESGAVSATVEQAGVTARVLQDLHFNMNLAPVADVLTVSGSEVMASRCYAPDPIVVSELSSAYVSSLQSAGLIATAKHFPGHGGTIQDSHHGLPILEIAQTEIRSRHLPPFSRLIHEGVAAVMTAHIQYKAFDSVPACMSETIVSDLLIDELGHKGIVITDDMMMGAVSSHCSVPDACVRSLQAGVSLLLVCSHPEIQCQALERVQDAVESGELSEARIDAALMRNLAVKRRFGIA